ncbi:MAG: GNAT family N-acetyltransferase [Rhizomicrobium sp.]
MNTFNAARQGIPQRPADANAPPLDTGTPVFEPGITGPDGTFVFIKNPPSEDMQPIHDMLRKEIGENVAPVEVIQSVYAANPMSFWGLYRSADARRLSPRLVGFIAFLPLNEAGNAALRAKKIDGRNPDLTLLAESGEDPVVLYLWAIVTPGLGNLAFALNCRAIGADLFERLQVIGWISTQSALDSVRRSSHTRDDANATIGSTFEIKFLPEHRAEMRALKVVEGLRPGQRRSPRPVLEAALISTADQMAKVMAIRAAVFMSEQNCPYDEEFDGNDYAGTHVLGTVNGEPAACLRIRYFANFVKIERLAVLHRFRRTLIAKQVVEQALEICSRKGYTKMYGQSQMRLVSFWERFGFKLMQKDAKLVFSDHEYAEIFGDIAPHPRPLTPETEPLILIRPEGKWDEPGVLDHSASRPATNPH